MKSDAGERVRMSNVKSAGLDLVRYISTFSRGHAADSHETVMLLQKAGELIATLRQRTHT